MGTVQKRGRCATSREVQMRGVLRELARSGLSLRAFARRRGIAPGTLSWWRFITRRRDQVGRGARRGPRPPRFVEIGIAAEDVRPRGEPVVFEVVLSRGRAIRVPAGFDPGTLQRLVATLEAPC
jgi:hypothetical protein